MLVQPLVELVTVTVYVPDSLTVGLAVVPPDIIPGPAQLKLVPLLVDAESMTDVVVQVSVPPDALAPGVIAPSIARAVAVLVHPFVEFVTVTVYVPAELTVGFSVVPPETIPGPAQLNPVPVDVVADRTIDVVAHVSVPPVALAPGVTMSSLTSAVAVLVQPLAELVTVTVNVPVALTLGFAVVPPETMPVPAQLKPVPVVDDAERTTDVVVQVNVPPVALAPGELRFSPTRAVVVLVQPLAELVTVTVNVPVALTLGFAVVPPETIPVPAQLKPMPLVDDAERTTDVVVQVNVPPVALAPGGVIFAFTKAVAVLVHPPAEFVTVTVYVPDELTVGLAVVPPLVMPGPAQLKLVPAVVEAERTTDVVVQVSVPPVAVAPGVVHLDPSAKSLMVVSEPLV